MFRDFTPVVSLVTWGAGRGVGTVRTQRRRNEKTHLISLSFNFHFVSSFDTYTRSRAPTSVGPSHRWGRISPLKVGSLSLLLRRIDSDVLDEERAE